MAASDKLFNSGILIMDNAEEALLLEVKNSEESLFKEIMKLFENVEISNGRLKNSEAAQAFLLTLDKKINAALKKAGYNQGVAKFVTNFDKISENVIKVQDKLNDVRLLASQLAPFQQVAVSDTVSALLGIGINKAFVSPIRQALYRSVMLGQKASEAEALIRNYVISNKGKDSVLLRYAQQVSRDSLGQYKGLVQANIADELGLNAGRYVGSIIKDSRSQCAKWASQGITLLTEFEKDLQPAIDGTLCFPVQGKEKCSSGMIAGTTDIPTFLINRGGWNCRHDLIPSKIFVK